MGRPQQMLSIDKSFFDALENQIIWAEGIPRKMPIAMDRLVRFMAYTNLGIAQKMSLGPVDPNMAQPSLAWKIPVRRISGRYFFGWKTNRVGLGHWQLYNDSREAFFIEFGISPSLTPGRRIRRPILKLSLMQTLKWMERTGVYHRVFAQIYYPSPSQRRGAAFAWHIQPAGILDDITREQMAVH